MGKVYKKKGTLSRAIEFTSYGSNDGGNLPALTREFPAGTEVSVIRKIEGVIKGGGDYRSFLCYVEAEGRTFWRVAGQHIVTLITKPEAE